MPPFSSSCTYFCVRACSVQYTKRQGMQCEEFNVSSFPSFPSSLRQNLMCVLALVHTVPNQLSFVDLSFPLTFVHSPLQVLFIGSGGVGKTATITRWINGHFILEYDFMCEDSFRKVINIGETRVLMSLMESYGCEVIPLPYLLTLHPFTFCLTHFSTAVCSLCLSKTRDLSF